MYSLYLYYISRIEVEMFLRVLRVRVLRVRVLRALQQRECERVDISSHDLFGRGLIGNLGHDEAERASASFRRHKASMASERSRPRASHRW